MAADVPTIAPTRATAGDTWTWSFAHDADYPAPTWVVSYAFRGIDAPVWDPAWVTVADQLSTIVIPAAQTAPLRGGTYSVTRLLTNGTGRVSAALEALVVEENPDTMAPGDTRIAKLERDIAIVRAARMGNLAGALQSYMIAGRQVTTLSPAELRVEESAMVTELKQLRSPRSFGRRVEWHMRPISS